MAGCPPLSPACNLVEGVTSGALANVANGVDDFVQWVINQLAFGWILNPIPLLIEADGTAVDPAPGLSPASVAEVTRLLGWIQGLALFVAALSLIIFGARLAITWRRDGSAVVDRLGAIFGGVFLVGSASFIVTALMPGAPVNAGGSAAQIQGSLWWFTLVLAMVSVLVGAIRMVWKQEAREGKEIVRSLLTLMAIASLGVTVVSLLDQVFSDFSRNYILSATDCGDDGECLGARVTELVWLGAAAGGNVLPAVAMIVLGLILGLFGALQFALMIGRSAVLLVLVGVLPLASSFSNTEMGMQWMRRIIAWTLAFLLYKPVAAIIFGTALRLAGSDPFSADGIPEGVQAAMRIVFGLIIFGLGVVALPALMRLMVPAVAPIVGGGAGMGMAVAGVAAIPAGASAIAELTGKGGRSAPSNSSPSPTSSAGQNPTGGQQTATRATQTASAGPAGGGAGAAGGGAGASAGAGAAAKGTAAVAGGAATAGAATAVIAAAEVASKIGKAGNDGAQKMARGATGDEEQ